MALEAAQTTFVEALGGEQEVHAEAAPDPADGAEQLQELGAGGQQLAELVHHDEQRGQRLEPRVDGHPCRVGAQVGLVAGQVQEPLAPGQLTLEGGQGAVDHRQVGLEIRDQPGDLWERGQVGEGGAALEVDQHEGELPGRVGGGQAGDDRAQQLALARPGGPHDQPVRADPTLGRLLEVEHQRLPARRDADRHPEQLRTGTRPHSPTRFDRAVGLIEEVEQAYRACSRRCRGWVFEPEGGQAAGQELAAGEVRRVGPDAVDPASTGSGLQEGREALVVEADAHRELGRLAGGGLGQPDHRDAGRRGTLQQLGARARLGRVHDREQVRAVGGRVAGVGQPAGPRPRRAGRRGVDHLDPEVVGGVEGGELAEEGAGEGARAGRWAGEGEDVEVAERNDHRGAGEPGGSADDLLGCFQQFGVVLLEGAAGGVEAGPVGEGDRASPDPHREEVAVGGATLPEAVGLVDDRPEGRWVGVEVLGDGELGGGQVVGLGRDLLEVGEVAGPVPAPGPAGGAALDQAEPEPGRHRGHGGPEHQGDQPPGPGSGDREQERDRPATPDQRHQVLQPTGGAGARPPHRRRGGDGQLGRRQQRRVRPHRPVHDRRGCHDGTLRPRHRVDAASRESVDNRVQVG